MPQKHINFSSYRQRQSNHRSRPELRDVDPTLFPEFSRDFSEWNYRGVGQFYVVFEGKNTPIYISFMWLLRFFMKALRSTYFGLRIDKDIFYFNNPDISSVNN